MFSNSEELEIPFCVTKITPIFVFEFECVKFCGLPKMYRFVKDEASCLKAQKNLETFFFTFFFDFHFVNSFTCNQ